MLLHMNGLTYPILWYRTPFADCVTNLPEYQTKAQLFSVLMSSLTTDSDQALDNVEPEADSLFC